MKPYFVYILLCSDKTYYIGITVDLDKRVAAHNGKFKGGAKYTSGRRPLELVYTEVLPTQSEALKREYFLKQLTREEKEKLIDLAPNPTSDKSA